MPTTGRLIAACRCLPLYALLALASPAALANGVITVGTDDHTGAYYRAGGGICSLVNAGRSEHRMRCRVTSTEGATANIDALRRGRWALGFASGDVARDARQGAGVFGDSGEFSGLRVVTALNHETVTVVARNGAGIDHVRDLAGQRVNVGAADSTQRALMTGLMNTLGWGMSDFADTRTLPQGEQVEAFCDGELDAILFVTSHPSRDVRTSLDCGGSLVPVSGTAINSMINDRDTYTAAAIPGGTYTGENSDIETYSVVTLLLSSTNTARNVIYEVTAAIYEDLDAFRGWHPAFADLAIPGMVGRTRDSGIELHPGAELYFDENDL